MCVVCVLGVGGFSHQRGFSQIKDLDCEILDYATERHIFFVPSLKSSRMCGQCHDALINRKQPKTSYFFGGNKPESTVTLRYILDT